MPTSIDAERPAGGATVVRLAGAIDAEHAGRVYDELRGLLRSPELEHVVVDFARVESFDSVAAAAVDHATAKLRQAGKRIELSNLTERQRSTFELVARAPVSGEDGGASPTAPEQGARAGALLHLAEFLVDSCWSCLKILAGRERLRARAVGEQALHLGINATGIVLLLSFLTGLILAFQAAFQLRRFGAEPMMAEIVGLGMVREFGALMTAIILSGRSGAAIAAELGTMSVREELDALRVIGVDPISYLVVPRVLALTLVQPALTMLATACGLLAGLLTAALVGMPAPSIFARMQESLSLNDFWLGFSKSLIFAWIIGFTGCYMGLRTLGGARSVGESTTRAVVTSILLVVVFDSVITTLWTNAGYGRR